MKIKVGNDSNLRVWFLLVLIWCFIEFVKVCIFFVYGIIKRELMGWLFLWVCRWYSSGGRCRVGLG